MCRHCSLNTLKTQRTACRTDVGFCTIVPCAPSGLPAPAKSSNITGCHTNRTMRGICCRLAVCAPSSTPQGPRVNTAELPSRPPDSILLNVLCSGRSVSCISNFKLTGMALEQLQEVFGPLVTEQLNSMEWAPTKREAEPSSAPSDRERRRARGARGSRPPQTNHPGAKVPFRWPQSDLSHQGVGQAGATTGDGAQDPQTGLHAAGCSSSNRTIRDRYHSSSQRLRNGRSPRKRERPQPPFALHCSDQMLHTGLRDIGGAAPTPFQTKAEEMKWLKDGSWCHQKWSPALGSLVIDEDRPPLQHAKLVEALQLVLPIILQPYMIHRFHATRPLAGNVTGVTTFQLDISNRTKGHNTVWECLEALTGLSALQIIGPQLRRDTLKQSPTAALVQQALAEYS